MRFLAAVAAALVLAGSALASEEQPTLAELESEVICPTCSTTLDQSNAPVAARLREFIRGRIAAGDTKSEIKGALVAQFGQRVLAAPPREGFNLLAWVLPFVALGVGAVVLGLLAWRWSRRRREEAPAAAGTPASNGRAPLDPELEQRLDEELARFDA